MPFELDQTARAIGKARKVWDKYRKGLDEAGSKEVARLDKAFGMEMGLLRAKVEYVGDRIKVVDEGGIEIAREKLKKRKGKGV